MGEGGLERVTHPNAKCSPAHSCVCNMYTHLHVWVRTDLSSYLKVVEMQSGCSDWKRVIIIIHTRHVKEPCKTERAGATLPIRQYAT
jgi:hypothetical protein